MWFTRVANANINVDVLFDKIHRPVQDLEIYFQPGMQFDEL